MKIYNLDNRELQVGMGQLKIVSGGLKLDGKAYILGNLIVSSIRSRTGQPIVFESTRNFTLRARNEKGKSSSWIKLGKWTRLSSNLRLGFGTEIVPDQTKIVVRSGLGIKDISVVRWNKILVECLAIKWNWCLNLDPQNITTVVHDLDCCDFKFKTSLKRDLNIKP